MDVCYKLDRIDDEMYMGIADASNGNREPDIMVT